jgi:hypothetical protein
MICGAGEVTNACKQLTAIGALAATAGPVHHRGAQTLHAASIGLSATSAGPSYQVVIAYSRTNDFEREMMSSSTRRNPALCAGMWHEHMHAELVLVL